jgi:GxxExxY protein
MMIRDVERLNEVTERIIGCAYSVSNELGVGFLEKVYENALIHELRKAGFNAEQQQPIKVLYDGVIVGDYLADIVVEESVILELKAVRAFDNVHFAQCVNYLRATGMKVCLLINFGRPKVEIKRFVN